MRKLSMTNTYNFVVETPAGEDFALNQYQGKALLIVNTASQCGFAPQFEGLQKLYEQYQYDDFLVLGFPCGQFKEQEFDDIEKTMEFCQMNYNVSFPMFAKIDVNGENAHPLYKYLKEEKKGLLMNNIKWNFTKFLIDKNGQVVERYAPTTKPEDIETDIKEIL